MINRLGGQALRILLLRAQFFFVRALAVLLLAKLMDPNRYGAVVLMFSVLEIARIIADFGFDNRLTGDFAREAVETHRPLFHKALKVKLIAALCAVPLTAGLMAWLEPLTRPYLFLLLSLPGVAAMTLSASYLQARKAIGRKELLRLSGASAFALLWFVISLWQEQAVWLLGGIVLFELISAWLICGPVLALLDRTGTHGTPAPTLRDLLSRAAPVALTGILATVYGRLDIFVLKRFVPPAELGRYALLNRIYEPLIMVAGTVGTAYYVRIAQSLGRVDSQPSPTAAYRSYGLFSLLCTAGFAAAGFIAVRLLDAYSAAAELIPYAAATVWIKVFNQGLVARLSGHARYSQIARIAVANFVVMLLLLLVGAGFGGAKGSLLAILATETLSAAAMLRILKPIA